MRKLFTILVLLMLQVVAWAQSTGRITGKIIDAKTGEALAGATVQLRGSGKNTLTDAQGNFVLSDVRAGKQTVVVSFVGYDDMIESVQVAGGTDVSLNAGLIPSYKTGNEVVVSASRRPEKITKAPASISVISARDLEQTSSFNIGELASKIQGVEFIRTGVTGVGFNARGFNNAFNAKVLQLTDGRNTMMAGGSGLPAGIMNTVVKEDVERLEIVLGPNSALYGPNAHNGVANTLTKDPRKFQGTTMVIGAGNRNVFSGRVRHATKINDKWAYKLTGEYTAGKDFEFYDSVFVGGSVYGPATSTKERNPDFNFRHMRGEAHVYYSINKKIDLIGSVGGSKNNFLAVNNVGRNQIRDWSHSFAQLRLVSPRLFAQVYETWANVGTSYGITPYTRDYYNRTHSTITDPASPLFPAFGRLYPDEAETFARRLGNQFKEKSRRFNAEAQYNYDFKNIGLFMVAGLSYQKDNPNTYGTSLADASQKVEVDQFGGALQLEKSLPADFKLVAAGRLDHHSVFGDMFAPKLGLVKGIPGGSVRLTWGKAFAAPIILFQSANVFGLVFGNGNGVNYTPNGSQLSVVNTTVPLKPEEISTWELGYKGTIGKKLYLDVNGYYGKSKNFLSPAIAVGGRVHSVGDIPIDPTKLYFPGTVNGDGVLNGALFSTYFNYGEVSAYGVDLGVNYYFTDNIAFNLKYSWFGSDITEDNMKNDANRDGFVSAEEKSLNAPKNRLAAGLNFSNLAKGKMFLNISGRWVQEHDFYSGSQIGTNAGEGKRGMVAAGTVNGTPRFYLKNFDHGALGGFTTFDISTGYKLNQMISLGAGMSNIFNVSQREFVGSPTIGRLFNVELKVHVPPMKGKK